MRTILTRVSAAVAVLLPLAACESNPPAMQPGALDAKAKLQRCCDQVDAAYQRVQTPSTRTSDSTLAWKEASWTCQLRLTTFDNDVARSIESVQTAVGQRDLVAEAPACRR